MLTYMGAKVKFLNIWPSDSIPPHLPLQVLWRTDNQGNTSGHPHFEHRFTG